MPRLIRATPSYRQHKASGQAMVIRTFLLHSAGELIAKEKPTDRVLETPAVRGGESRATARQSPRASILWKRNTWQTQSWRSPVG